ncbi:MAG TPA: class I SAM-dependent methyltransferase [Acidimicrobiales bacterium]|nr:class I SAM-dependent methyltransferase [Acidimicrobiales bacterium]
MKGANFVLDIFRYTEISESSHRIFNPLSEAKLDLLGQICRLGPGQRHLDLACGRGEMLCRYARDHGTNGVGIDIYPPQLRAARARAAELGVTGAVRFVEGDAAHPEELGSGFDLVSCIGATWIGNGLEGTLDIMKARGRPGAFIVVGDVFWANEPRPEVRREREAAETFADLGGTLERIEGAGLELVEMLIATSEEWDRYQATQWMSASDWVAAHPGHPDAAEVAAWTDRSRRSYLCDLRASMGWGVFVTRQPGSRAAR